MLKNSRASGRLISDYMLSIVRALLNQRQKQAARRDSFLAEAIDFARRNVVLVRSRIRTLVDCFPSLSRFTGYRYVSAPGLASMKAMGLLRMSEVLPESEFNRPLPMNVASVPGMPTEDCHGRSFAGAVSAGLESCWVGDVREVDVHYRCDQWKNHFFSVIAPGPRALPFGNDQLRSVLRGSLAASKVSIVQASWFLDAWPNNHYHWFATMLPRALLIRRLHVESPLLIPHDGLLTPVMRRSLELIGCASNDVLETSVSPVRVESLHFVTSCLSDARLQSEMREVVLEKLCLLNQPRTRRLYITRSAAQWRRVINEEEVFVLLREFDIEIVDPAQLRFDEQVRVFSQASVVVSPHGAGLVNIMFCQRGAKVVEISNPDLPNPDYYILASNLGHEYYIQRANPSRARSPAYDDLTVCIKGLRKVLQQVFDVRA